MGFIFQEYFSVHVYSGLILYVYCITNGYIVFKIFDVSIKEHLIICIINNLRHYITNYCNSFHFAIE